MPPPLSLHVPATAMCHVPSGPKLDSAAVGGQAVERVGGHEPTGLGGRARVYVGRVELYFLVRLRNVDMDRSSDGLARGH
eukprot:365210-Chlamydomonas_euryale.AAC.10